MAFRSLFNPLSPNWWERHFIQAVLMAMALLLLATHTYFWHYDFLLHLSAVMVELFLTLTIITTYLKMQEARTRDATDHKVRELLFRISLTDLVYHALRVTKNPSLSLDRLESATGTELNKLMERVRSQGFDLELSREEWPAFIQSLLKAEPVLQKILEREQQVEGSMLFESLLVLLHGIHDVRLAEQRMSRTELLEFLKKNEVAHQQVRTVVQCVVILFLQYLIESANRDGSLRSRILREMRDLEYFQGLNVHSHGKD